MGKAALILVAAVTVASGITYMNQDRQEIESVMQEALYEHGVLAREVAKSGFNTVMSRVKADFDNYRTADSDMSHKRGTMDMSALGTSGGPVTVSVTGYYEEAEFQITGTLKRSGGTLLDALTIDGPVKKFEVGVDADISGLDTKPDGTDGTNSDVHAVRSIVASAHTTVAESLPEGKGAGTDGLNDIVQGQPTEVTLSGIVTTIQTYEGAYLDEYTGKTTFTDETIGSFESPRLLRVNGDVELKGTTTGYGVLYVEGDLTMQDDARWEGLVYTTGDKAKYQLKNDARIYGVFVASAISEDGPGGDSNGGGGLPGGHFDVDVFDMARSTTDEIYHEHQYDDDYDVTGVDLLDPTGCKTGGGLCWEEVLGTAGEVWVEFANPDASQGSYRINDGTTNLMGNPADGLSLTKIDASSIQDFWVDFDALCHLQESSPGDVQKDAVSRNGAFTIRIYEDAGTGGDGGLGYMEIPRSARQAGFSFVSWMTALSGSVVTLLPGGSIEMPSMWMAKIWICHFPPGNPANVQKLNISTSAWSAHDAHGDVQIDSEDSDCPAGPGSDGGDAGGSDGGDDGGSSAGALMYELAVYHHINEDFPCGGTIEDDSSQDSSYGAAMEIKVKDDALIQYSALALSRAVRLLNGYAIGEGEVTLTDVTESGVRAKRRFQHRMNAQ